MTGRGRSWIFPDSAQLAVSASRAKVKEWLRDCRNHFFAMEIWIHCKQVLIRAYVRHVQHCKRYYDFIEKIDDNNYKCKLCLNITYKSRFPLYRHIMKQHNLDNRLPDPEVLQNDAKTNDAMEEKE